MGTVDRNEGKVANALDAPCGSNAQEMTGSGLTLARPLISALLSFRRTAAAGEVGRLTPKHRKEQTNTNKDKKNRKKLTAQDQNADQRPDINVSPVIVLHCCWLLTSHTALNKRTSQKIDTNFKMHYLFAESHHIFSNAKPK